MPDCITHNRPGLGRAISLSWPRISGTQRAALIISGWDYLYPKEAWTTTTRKPLLLFLLFGLFLLRADEPT